MHTEHAINVPGEASAHFTPPLLVGSVWRQLNSMRVLRQYTLSLSRMCKEYAFLQGHNITCVQGLEWFSNLNKPMLPLGDDVKKTLDHTINCFLSIPQNQGMTHPRAAFEVHAHLPCPDRDMLRLTIQMHFQNVLEYEVDLCRHMISVEQLPYSEWLNSFASWRSRGLYYPLALAARRMSTAVHWFASPPPGETCPVAKAFFHALSCLSQPQNKKDENDGQRQQQQHRVALEQLTAAWENDTTGVSRELAGTLDRLAVLMRVKSNGRIKDPRDFNLENALKDFPDYSKLDMHKSNYSAWHSLKGEIEDAFPPSTLCAPLTRPRRSTWGYPRLTLELLPGSILRFHEQQLQLVPGTQDLLGKPEAERGSAYPSSFSKNLFDGCLASQTPSRIQDILWRTGELMMSAEIALCMLYPTVALASLDGASDPVWRRYSDYCSNKEHIINSMQTVVQNTDSGFGQHHFMRYIARLEACLPQLSGTKFPAPLDFLLWRVDLPPRLLIYTGSSADVAPDSPARHEAPKLLVNGKANPRTISRLIQLEAHQHTPFTEQTVRDSVRLFGKNHLLDHMANTVLVKGHGPAIATTLAETLASFTLATRPEPIVRELGELPSRWDGDSIDECYAERQDGENGFRFRDWTAMHVGESGTHQSRLAAHLITCDSLLHTQIPWLTEDGGICWVQVASTAPPENRTIQGHTLRQAVEARYMHDLRMLPVRNPGDSVLRANAELYAEGEHQVAIAYTPTGEKCPARVELALFQCQPATTHPKL